MLVKFDVLLLILDPIEREQRKQTLCLAYSGIGPSSFFGTANDTVESVVGKLKKVNCQSLDNFLFVFFFTVY